MKLTVHNVTYKVKKQWWGKQPCEGCCFKNTILSCGRVSGLYKLLTGERCKQTNVVFKQVSKQLQNANEGLNVKEMQTITILHRFLNYTEQVCESKKLTQRNINVMLLYVSTLRAAVKEGNVEEISEGSK